MLFSTNPKVRSIERMMTSAPGSRPKGHGVYVFGRHKYTAEECDGRLCPHYKRKKCNIPKCECIEERIGAVEVGYAEFMKHTLAAIKNTAFQVRFAKYINDESEMMFMLYRGDAHKEMFERAIERSLTSDNAMLSALYLLTADKYLWSKIRFAIGNSAINFSAVRLGDVSTDAYTLYMTARDLYSGTKHITVSDLADTDLITNKMFGILCNAMAIRRYGMKAIEIAKKDGGERC
ncbi:MAG: hypothetical protein PHV32_19580 [Eubacteriales bacterium]|nr:hypothetical protein [Eubacteriales bacterium]